jgi:hypothetical protein
MAEEFPLQGRYGQGVIACKLPRGAKLIGILAGKRTQVRYRSLFSSGSPPFESGCGGEWKTGRNGG